MSRESLNQFLDPLDLFGGQAATEAHNLQARLAELGLNLESDFFNQIRDQQAPVRNARDAALQFLRQVQSGESELPADPSLGFQEDNALRDISKISAAQGKSLAGGTRIAEQDALATLKSQSTQNQLNRILNIAGYQTNDLLNGNSLIAQNTDSQANLSSGINSLNNASRIGQSNAIMNLGAQGGRLAGSVLGGQSAPPPQTYNAGVNNNPYDYSGYA